MRILNSLGIAGKLFEIFSESSCDGLFLGAHARVSSSKFAENCIPGIEIQNTIIEIRIVIQCYFDKIIPNFPNEL
jgi:hypothetical protein